MKKYIAAFVLLSSIHGYSQTWNLAGNSGTTNADFIGTTDAKQLLFRTNNLNRALIDASGNFGIGTASPTSPLAVFRDYGSGSSGNIALFGGKSQWSANDWEGIQVGFSYLRSIYEGQGSGGWGFSIRTGASNGTGEEAFRVSSFGHVSIGSATVENSEGWGKALQVYNGGSSKILAVTPNVNTGIWSHESGYFGAPTGGIAGTWSNHPYTLITNKTARLTVDINGNVGIGTTTPGAKISFSNVDAVNTPEGITWFNSNPLDYGIYRTPGTWAAPNYQQMKLRWDGGIVLDPGLLGNKSYVDVAGNGLHLGNAGINVSQDEVNIGKNYLNGKISFTNVDATTNSLGLSWFNTGGLHQTVYAIHRTEGAWTAPDYQQLRLGWDAGIILDPGTGYGKSYVEVKGNGMRVTSGSLAIGTAPVSGYKLAVAGNIITEKVRVKLQANWPDYVFGKQYELMPLSELEQYIQKHQHLPEIPSAKEVEEKGLDLGDNQALLLKKIEELTLHMIELNKKVEALTEENRQLKKN